MPLCMAVLLAFRAINRVLQIFANVLPVFASHNHCQSKAGKLLPAFDYSRGISAKTRDIGSTK